MAGVVSLSWTGLFANSLLRREGNVPEVQTRVGADVTFDGVFFSFRAQVEELAP